MSLERRPVQIVEIDLDTCTRTYGSAPCTAALAAATPRKCFNSFATCQDAGNFDKGAITLRFSQNQSGLPKGVLVYPALRSVSTNPAQINLGGIDDRTGPLGKRARVTLDFQDFADNDTGLDRYQGERVSGAAQHSGIGYDPAAQGTFFGRLRARNPYYVGRAVRVLDGYEGEALAAMRTRHFVIAEWEGPGMDGRVRIVAKDVLDLADNEKALCPSPNTGKLASDIEAADVATFDILPAGTGDAEYAAAGRIGIGSEIMTFTRAGDTFTITGRGVDGTTPASHSTSDLVQQCYRVERTGIDKVAQELLEDYAGISSAFVPIADWGDEMIWLAGFDLTATIAKPTGVAKLIGELAQHGVFWWWDDVAQEIRMRANRPPLYGDEPLAIRDDLHIVEGSLDVSDLHLQRLTQVIFWHGMLDATKTATDGENFARAHVAVNDGGSTLRHDQDRVQEVFSRWLGVGDDTVAASVANRLVTRFEETPLQVSFILDAKDRENVAPADLITLTTRAIQDETGASRATEMQVTSVDEHRPGHALKVTAVSFQFSGRFIHWLDDAISATDYDSASTEDKAAGFYWFDEAERDFGDGTGGFQWF